MNPNLITENEMNSFFNGVAEFQSRLATTFVAMSEQAALIDALRSEVAAMRAEMSAMVNTVRQLTEDRDQARFERDRAVSAERVALDLASEHEHERNAAQVALKDAMIVISTLTDAKNHLADTVKTLREQNDTQFRRLEMAVQDNQGLQDRIADLKSDHEKAVTEISTHYDTNVASLRAELDRCYSAMKRDQENIHRLHAENRKLTNTLSVAKTILEDIPPQETSVAA